MTPARAPREDPAHDRLLVIGDGYSDRTVTDLPALLDPGDLLVVNDAATLPASVPGDDRVPEWRLAAHPAPGLWWAVAFGAGDWRDDTDHRPSPPLLARHDRVRVAGVEVRVAATSPLSPRLVLLAAPDHAFLDAVYATGRPVQYSYLEGPVALEDVQTPWAGAPWAVEAPSAGFPLRWRVVDALRARGVRFAPLTHAAGLSATGDAALDRALPLPERYRVPQATLEAAREARAAGRRVVAVGTSAMRALESAARGPSEGTTRLRIGAETRLRLATALLSNVHGPGEPHFRLMTSLVPEATLVRAAQHARESGYLAHEFGDAFLVCGS